MERVFESYSLFLLLEGNMAKEDTPKETNPQDDMIMDEGIQPPVGSEETPQPNKEEAWKKIDAVFNVARSSFLEKNVSLVDVVDSLIATLMDILSTEKHSLGGLGTDGPKANLIGTESQDEVPE
jgi:hypothetical protein